MCDEENLPGGIRIFRVRIAALEEEKLFRGREDEFEVLIQGTVEGVTFSESEEGDDD